MGERVVNHEAMLAIHGQERAIFHGSMISVEIFSASPFCLSYFQ
jgi:hypothetical protein